MLTAYSRDSTGVQGLMTKLSKELPAYGPPGIWVTSQNVLLLLF